ncbi:MAG: hypothetical protein PVF15_08090 [Candidatus Bathyarchaeota archaeon]|jgi:hypothetical protein
MTRSFSAVKKSSFSSVQKSEGRIDKLMVSLDDLLLDMVDETVKQVFREPGAKAIYNYIENECHLKREEIAKKPEVFSADLKRLLGSGSQMIEKMILKNLYRRLELKFTVKEGYEFSDYIKELRKLAVVKE